METFPPAGFIPTESHVNGITVYMPAPISEKHEEVVNFRCPQCDGETAFNAADGGLTCTYCGFHEEPEQEIVGKSAETFEFTVDTVRQASHGWGVERQEIVCQTCTSHIVVETGALTTSCPFCNSNKVIQHKAPQDVLRPRFLIPFTIDDDQCHEKVRLWLGDSWLVPKELRRVAAVGDFTPMFLPFWTFDADTIATWKAEVGKTKTVRRGGKTTTKTVWRWENGRVHNIYRNVKARGSQRLSPVLMKQVQDFDLEALRAYDASFLAGTQALAYETALEESWAKARHAMRERTRQACRQQASSGRIRNFSMHLDFSDEAWRYILLPIYICNYHYNNKSYQLLVNGQSGVVAGQRPADWRKIALVSIVPMVLAALVMLYQWFVQMGDGNDLNAIAIGLFLLGVALAVGLGIQGAKLDDA